jgi:CheY-like chemotaxis protein
MAATNLRSSRVPLPKDELSILPHASRGELLAHLSHELRTPLNTVLGTAELLAGSALTADQRLHVEMLARAGAQLLALANELLAFPRDASPEPQVARRPTAPTVPPESLAGVRLLVVDDSEESRDLVAAYLASTGAVLAFAGTGAAALDMLDRETFDLVLMDLNLPDGGGFDITRALRRAERESGANQVPVVALSADLRACTRTRALAAGFAAHLAKPITRATLREAIATHRRHSNPSPSPALMDGFLAHRAREVVTARAALRRGDFDLLVTLGHNLRGNGVSYGFPRLSALGQHIERAALARQEGDLEELLGQLADAVVEATGGAEPRAKVVSGTQLRQGRRERRW